MRTCEKCGGPLNSQNRSGICWGRAECRSANERCKRERMYSGPTGHLRATLRKAKERSTQRNIPFRLDLETMPAVPADCPCCGIRFILGGPRSTAPEFDRIIPARGYVPGNVQWLCGRCNRIKYDANGAELMRLALFVQAAELSVEVAACGIC